MCSRIFRRNKLGSIAIEKIRLTVYSAVSNEMQFVHPLKLPATAGLVKKASCVFVFLYELYIHFSLKQALKYFTMNSIARAFSQDPSVDSIFLRFREMRASRKTWAKNFVTEFT